MDRGENVIHKGVSRRLEWMDVAKGIAIILMVVGHTSIPKSLSDFIWTFHMPLFFIASGWLTSWNKNTAQSFIRNKSKNLLLPFFSYSMIVLCVKCLLLPEGGIPYLVYWLTLGWDGIALWFIPVLFVALVISKFIIGLREDRLIVGGCIALALLGGLLSHYRIHLPWTLSSIPYATALVIIGYFAKRSVGYMEKYKGIIIILGFGITFIISRFYRLDICFNSVTPIFLLTIGALSGVAMTFSFSSLLLKTKYIAKFFQKVGQETFIILGLSQIIIVVLKEYTELGAVLRYSILVIILILIKYIKDAINHRLGIRIL